MTRWNRVERQLSGGVRGRTRAAFAGGRHDNAARSRGSRGVGDGRVPRGPRRRERSDLEPGAPGRSRSVADREAAAGCAVWLAFGLFHRGAAAPGGGWIARAARLLEEAGHDSVIRGYLLVFDAIRRIDTGDFSGAHAPSSRLSRSHNGLGIAIWPGLRDMGEAVR